jgi:hypothetical protein
MKRKPLIAKRSVGGSSVLPDGTVVQNPRSDVPFKASIQPADRKQLESYPFLRDFKQLYTLFSDTELLTANAETSECDMIDIYGTDFEVLTCEHWQNNIRSHYKIIVGR